MFLPIFSAGLGILAFSTLSFSYVFGFIFLTPLFIFLLREEKLWRLILGVFIFKIILLTAAFFFAFDPYIFLLSILVFLGLPIIVFLIKKLDQKIPQKIPLLFLSLPFLWIFFENLQARYSFLPVYIGTSGNIFGNSPFLGLAALGGLNILSFFAILINMLVATVIFNFEKKIFPKLNSLFIIFIIFIIIIGWQFSQIKLNQNFTFYENQNRTLKVALLSNNGKFDEEFLIFKNEIFTEEEKTLAGTMVEEKLNPLKADLKNQKIDLLILPEHMIEIEIWNDTNEEAWIKFNISNNGILIGNYANLAKELNTYLAATLTTIRNNKRYNTTILFNRKGELVDIYDKSRLTIAGEYWPFGNWRPFYYEILQKVMPEVTTRSPVFNQIYQYSRGERKLLRTEDFSFASLICGEIHYPNEVKIFKDLGAEFISHNSNNIWIDLGLKNYLNLTDNLRRIEAVWLKIPILINGRYEMAGVIRPDGKIDSVKFENSDGKNYGLFIGEIKY